MNKLQDPTRLRGHAAEAAEFLKIMANEQRLMILCSLWEGEQTVGAVSEMLNMRQPNISQHLAKLRMAGFVDTRRVGTRIYYRIAEETVRPIVGALYQRFCASRWPPQ